MKSLFQSFTNSVYSYYKHGVISIVLTILFTLLSAVAVGQTTIFQFDFEGSTAPTIDNAVGTPAVNANGITPAYSGFLTCLGSNSYYAAGWSAGENYEFTVNTTGYVNLTFSYCDAVAGDRFNSILVRVSPDGTNWTTVLNSYDPAQYTTVTRTTNIFPTSCENASTVYIQIYKDDNPFRNRNYYIDNATLTGDVANPTSTLSSLDPAVGASNIYQGGTNQVLYYFTTDITNSDATLNSLSFTTSGTYTSSDITLFRLLYNTSYDFYTASQTGSDITNSLGIGTHTFTGLSQTTSAGTKGHFWIVANLDAGAVPSNTISVNALTASDLTYASATVNGTAYAGGVQTIEFVVDSDGDGVGDLFDYDDDNDGVTDEDENQPCNTSPAELFTNGDFESGNIGFTSDYLYNPVSGWDEGVYTVTDDPSAWHPHFSACGDATTGSGNMMVINASPVEGTVIWSSGSIAITPNTTYTFSLNLASVHPSNPADLIFRINGIELGAIFSASSTTCIWENVGINWNSGSLASTTFEIINKKTIAGGNDFALDNISCTYFVDCDSDGDGVVDRLDRDSDNDGIYDLIEAGGTDSNNDGIIDNTIDADGDGLADIIDNINSGHGAIEVQSGTPLPNPDTDSDGSVDRIDTDSDGDLCNDPLEAGFTDPDDDGMLGNSPVTIDSWGVVTGSGGYTTPDNNDSSGGYDYLQQVPYISAQPVDQNICLLSVSDATFSVPDNNSGGTYQWEVSSNGGSSWSDVVDGGIYSGATTNTLNLTGLAVALDNYLFRLKLTHPAYACSPLYSDVVTLRVHSDLPAAPGSINGWSETCPAIIATYSILSVPNSVTYNWSVPTGWSINSGTGTTSIDVTTGAVGQNGNIAVSTSNSCGTSSESTLPVAVAYPAPAFTVAPVTDPCQSEDVTYTTQVGKSNYNWNVPGTDGTDYSIISGGIGATDNTVTLRWLTTGSKTVTVTYTAGGCEGPTPAASTINVIPGPIVDAGSNESICSGYSIDLSTITIIPSASNYSSLLWTTSGDGSFDDNTSLTPVYTPGSDDISLGSVVLTLNVTAIAPCSNVSDFMSVIINAVPDIVNPGNQTACGNYALPVIVGTNLTGNQSYYTGSGGSGSPLTAGTSITSTQTIYIYDETGTSPNCFNEESFVVTVNALPTVDLGADQTICADGSATFDAGAGFSAYSWSTGDATQTITVNTTGTYSVTV
ncbi:MAG: hypothetical protein JW894_09660, partial [Bacteroidales bacterium]|nr:hypothetical protein [Bacteroidales bacterium]